MHSHLYKGVWRSVESEFLRWKVALQALTMTSATRWQLIANEINLDWNWTNMKKIMAKHRDKVQHYQSSGGHFGWAEEYYRGEQKTKTFEWSFCPAIAALKDDMFKINLGYQALFCCLGDVREVDQGYQLADEELVWCSDGRWTPLFSEKEIVWFTNYLGQRPLTNRYLKNHRTE